MSQALLMEFPTAGVDVRAIYFAVLEELGFGESEQPDGGISHTAAVAESGEFVVFEVWESREAQERFLESRLMPALQKAGAPAPSRVLWLDDVLGVRHGGGVTS